MIVLDTHLARHEIERRLRAADHHRRSRWGRMDLESQLNPRWPGARQEARRPT